ncbi:MAG: hypothetical protein ACPGU5_06880 [Lishizhenia sp.]
MCTGLGFWSSAQNLITVDVLQELDYGGIHLYIMTDGQTNINYKSSASQTDILDVGNSVELDLSVSTGDYPMYIDGSSSTLIARAVASSNSNSGFNMTNNILYNLPYQEGDILFFENTQHIIDLSELLYEQENADINSNPSLEDSSIVFAFENEFPNFVSFREGMMITFVDQEVDGYDSDDMDAYYAYDHIHDNALKSFFNKYKLIGIGDSVYYYHNTNQIAHCHKDSTSSVQILREAGNELKEDDIFFGNDLLLDPNIEMNSDKYDVIKGKDIIYITSGSSHYSYSSIAYREIDNQNCNILKQGFRYEINKSLIDPAQQWLLDLSTYSNQMIIDWGDNSPLEIIDNYGGEIVYHTFPTENVYYATVKFTLYDNAFNIIQTLEFNDNSTTTELDFNTFGACTILDDTEHTYKELGQWRLSSRLWVNHNIFGKHVGSYSHAWKYKNGKWRRRKANITTTVDGNFYDDQCQFSENKNGSKNQDSRRVQKTKSKLFAGRKNSRL